MHATELVQPAMRLASDSVPMPSHKGIAHGSSTILVAKTEMLRVQVINSFYYELYSCFTIIVISIIIIVITIVITPKIKMFLCGPEGGAGGIT